MWTLYRCRQLRIRNWHQTEQADRQKSKQVQPINLCLVGVILGRIENEWEKKWCFWLFGWGWKRGKILAGFTSFLSSPLKHNISKFKRNKSEKWKKKKDLDKIFHIFFFGYLNPAVNVAYLPTQKQLPAFFLVGCLPLFFFFFFFNWALFLIRTYE